MKCYLNKSIDKNKAFDYIYKKHKAQYDKFFHKTLGNWDVLPEEKQDLKQVGLVAIYNSLDRYKEGSNASFFTYSTSCAYFEMVKYLRTNRHRLVRIPQYLMDIYNAIMEDRRKYGEEDDIEVLATRTGFTPARIENILSHWEFFKQNWHNADLSDCPWADSYHCYNNTSSLEKDMDREQIEKECLKIVKNIYPKNVDIFKMYYGLEGCEPHTLADISQLYGMSRQAVFSKLNYINNRLIKKFNNSDKKSNSSIKLGV